MDDRQPSGAVTCAALMGFGVALLTFEDSDWRFLGYFLACVGGGGLMYLTEGRNWKRAVAQTWLPLAVLIAGLLALKLLGVIE